LLLYHFVCPSKYRREVFTKEVEKTLKETCEGISHRYEIRFIEIGSDEDHVHFLVQSVPMYSLKKAIQIIKSITAIEIFKLHPEVKQKLWGGKFWTSGYYVNTVGQYANGTSFSNSSDSSIFLLLGNCLIRSKIWLQCRLVKPKRLCEERSNL